MTYLESIQNLVIKYDAATVAVTTIINKKPIVSPPANKKAQLQHGENQCELNNLFSKYIIIYVCIYVKCDNTVII